MPSCVYVIIIIRVAYNDTVIKGVWIANDEPTTNISPIQRVSSSKRNRSQWDISLYAYQQALCIVCVCNALKARWGVELSKNCGRTKMSDLHKGTPSSLMK